MGEDIYFCTTCGIRLNTVDEINLRLCNRCKQSKEEPTKNKGFFCWACGKKLQEKSEIAQGLCHNCKASINRKIGIPPLEQ